MKKIFCNGGLTVLLALVLSACVSSIDVSREAIVSPADISGAKTYRWDNSVLVGVADNERYSRDYQAIIERSINEKLQEKGFELVGSGEADMIVASVITIKADISETEIPVTNREDDFYTSRYGVRWVFGPGVEGVNLESATPEVVLTSYEVGTLHLGFFDSSGRMAWHASARKILNTHHSEAEHAQVLEETVRQLIKGFSLKSIR